MAAEIKRKKRLAVKKRFDSRLANGGQWGPNYNSDGCIYFEMIMETTGCFIQHAENGGEFYANGYWADGYDEENNIWYEWDEKHHFNLDGTYKKKDNLRQKEIIDFLKCYFVRIKAA